MASSASIAERGGLGELIEQVMIGGDLAQLTPSQRANYYRQVCESLSLNPLTKPFEYITLNNKLTLYARKDCTDQLRGIRGVSITKLERERLDELYVVTAYAKDSAGRIDSALGVVNVKGLAGENLANALMKAETKAKRRVTLSLCGLGWTDESEIESIPSAHTIVVDQTTGEVLEERPAKHKVTRDEAFDRYMKLYARAEAIGIPLDGAYDIADDDGVREIAARGALLKGIVDAHQGDV